MRVVQSCGLCAQLAEQSRRLIQEPVVRQRLLVKKRARIWCGQRDLDRVRVNFGREADRLLDGFSGLAWQAEDECAVDDDAKFVAIFGEPPGYIYPHPLLDIV